MSAKLGEFVTTVHSSLKLISQYIILSNVAVIKWRPVRVILF